MSAVNIVFPHQLFEDNPLISNGFEVYLVEEYLFFGQYQFHKQKIAFHRASMRRYADYLREGGSNIHYIDAQNPLSDIRNLLPFLAEAGKTAVHIINPTDNWLETRLKNGAAAAKMALYECENPLFLNSRNELKEFFKSSKKKFFQTKFYKGERKKRQILIDKDQNAIGGKWSYDDENRKKYPRKKTPPSITFPDSNPYYEEAYNYVQEHFEDNPGQLNKQPFYPIDFETSKKWLDQFLERRFHEFGPYEDAILKDHGILHHSVLTPMLNIGLLTPQYILDEAIAFAKVAAVPINSLEGFVRQIIGWREFIRGVYECKGSEARTRNYWGFTRKIPASFYNGTTGILPFDNALKKVLETGYCHHIERLMVLGNFMMLCEFDPDEVYRWFMELFVDAYDWVMVPNVYGMSQFADGGLMSTKPYISGSNYLMKMSDFPKGPWQATWDALFWRFMHVHRVFFLSNPRLGMLVRMYDKMDNEKQHLLLETADTYLQKLEVSRD